MKLYFRTRNQARDFARNANRKLGQKAWQWDDIRDNPTPNGMGWAAKKLPPHAAQSA